MRVMLIRKETPAPSFKGAHPPDSDAYVLGKLTATINGHSVPVWLARLVLWAKRPA